MNDLTHRLDGLEMRIAEQDRIIDDLNVTITAQWNTLDALRRDLTRVADRLRDTESRLPGEADRPPPHY